MDVSRAPSSPRWDARNRLRELSDWELPRSPQQLSSGRGKMPAAFCQSAMSLLRTQRRRRTFQPAPVGAAALSQIDSAAAAMGLTMVDLPVEILMLIFGYLSAVERGRTVAQVCSSWRAMCQAPLFWTKVTIPQHAVKYGRTRELRGRLVLTLHTDNIKPFHCVNYVPHCIRVYRQMLNQHTDHIRTLHVDDRYCELSEVFDHLQFPNLKTVKLEYISFEFGRALVKACPAVEDLVLSYYTQHLDTKVFDAVCSWRHLRRVDISCQLEGFGGERIYSQLFQNCDHLEWVGICLGRHNDLSDTELHVLVQLHHTTLSRFALNSDNITTLAPLLDCRRLTHLKLFVADNIPDDFADLNMLPELTHLELSDYHPSSFALCKFFSRRLKLTHLRLSYMDITSAVMGRIATSCSQLQILFINVDSVTNEMVTPLFDHTMRLHSMTLWADINVTADIIRLIPSKLPELRRLFLSPGKISIQELLPEMDTTHPMFESWSP